MNLFFSPPQRILPVLMLIVLFSSSVFAQYWSRTSPNVYLTTSTDNVGIGTTTPAYKLDVIGTFHIANGNQAFFSNSGTAALPSITFDNDANTGFFNPGNADVIGFATQGVERMRIDQAGVVGIGTSTPGSGYKLDVNGVLHVTNGNQALFSYTSTANMPAIAFDINNNTGIFSPSDDNFAIATGGQERLRINPNGYVGIGTTNPGNGQSVSLHVNGPVMLTNIPVMGGAATYYLGVEGSTGILKTRTPSQVFSDISGGACPPNPMTTLGDMMYGGTAGACTRFAGNAATTRKFLSQVGTGAVSAMPSWYALSSADVGLGNVENTKLSTWTGSASITTLGTIAAGSIPWSLITGAPAIPPAQVNSDWNATSGLAKILNKPTTLLGYGIIDAAPLNHGVATGYVAYANSPTSLAASPLFTSGGNIGIGTTAPGSKLQVQDGSVSITNGDLLVIKNPDSGYAAIIYGDMFSSGNFSMNGIFSAGFVNAAGIDCSGDLTIDAGNDLTMEDGSISVTRNPLDGVALNVSGNMYLGGGTLNMGESQLIAGSVRCGNVVSPTGSLAITGDVWGTGSSSSLNLGDNNHYIRATYGTGVSIGSYLADNALTIAQVSGDVTVTKGNLSVTNGKINVKGWSIEEAPDYVFEKDYKLPKLKEVETYVKEHKHLADVPSATDMNKNGLDLTSMNMKLLKKVEELTLYTIEQNKRIEALEKKLEKR